jgi:hypothetical protein
MPTAAAFTLLGDPTRCQTLDLNYFIEHDNMRCSTDDDRRDCEGAPRRETTGIAPLLLESTREGDSPPFVLLLAHDSNADGNMLVRGASHCPDSHTCMSTCTCSCASGSLGEAASGAQSGLNVITWRVMMTCRGLAGPSSRSRAQEWGCVSRASAAPSTSVLGNWPFARLGPPSSKGDRGVIAAEPLASCTGPSSMSSII